MNVLDEFKNYKRKFIQISHRTAILMHIFEKSDDDFEDIILSDHLENKILEKEMELENFFNNDNISKF